MQKYQTIKKLGSGAFGNVEMAQDTITKEIVAIKRLNKKYGTWEECLQLSEVKALRKMQHEHIIKLKEVIRMGNEAYFVFEYIQRDLFQFMNARKEKGGRLQNAQIRAFTKQLAEALAYIHKQGFFHRDLKPENVLVGTDLTIKIIDFGIAREIRSKPPFTQYVSTRWYRAPELLFRSSAYSATVDVFALGCIVAEMYLGRPLFQSNSEMDQISQVVSLLGSPAATWPQGVKQAALKGINLPDYPEVPLETVIKNCPADGLSFISECLRWNPSKRITPAQMLAHPFLKKEQQAPKKAETMKIEKTDYKMVRPAERAEKKKFVMTEDDFDGLLNDFDNYKLPSSLQKEEDDWF